LSGPLGNSFEIVREWGVEAHLHLGGGMLESEAGRVKELSWCSPGQLPGPTLIGATHSPLPPRTIEIVPHDGVPEMSRVHPNLMRTTRPESYVQ